ncbi:hypothetical protein [Enterocloster bolteae]|uniref:hypothetical protein n=1 Tax=Enterocloster bolteae TaxID=208479 RepID=UPI003AF17708
MEENTNMTEQTQAENMGNESEAQGAAGKEDRPTGFVQIGAASNNGQLPVADPVRKAMGLE